MKIRTRAYLLGMLPALLMAAILVPYLSASRLDDLEATLRNRGMTLARFIAESAQYAVISGNVASLEPVLERARSEADVVHMAIYRPDGNPVVSLGAAPAGLVLPLRALARDSAGHVAFSVPVEITAAPVDDPFIPEAREARRVVAWVQVVMSRAGNARIAREMLLHSLGIVALGILFTLALVRALALTGIRPLMEIIATVRRIGEGDLSGRLPLSAKSELKTLQVGINQMSESIEANQREMLVRIDDATAEMARQKEAAEQANLAKSKFLATVSHDLRQPLHALGLFTASLKQLDGTPEQRVLVEKIEASVNAQEEMFNALLDLSRLEAGTLHPQAQSFALRNILDRVTRDYAAQAREKGLRLAVRPCPFGVRSDPVLLARILSNLVSNALRYTSRGGIVVAARKRGDRVSIQVWDTGLGIGAADLPHIFEEYFQVGNAARNRREGLGLGLNIVQRLCRLLGHAIEVRSRQGRGSVFTLTLPRVDEQDLERRHSPGRDWSHFDRQWVVIIEDDADARDALKGLLTGWGLNVLAAENADAALTDAPAVPAPDLVISDFRLAHGENGVAAIALLRRTWGENLPALLISGDTAPESMAAMAASGLAVLHKPVRPAKLRALLRSLLYS
jgi:signal transduction histidine kinase/CheY-like chemotaxis protein